MEGVQNVKKTYLIMEQDNITFPDWVRDNVFNVQRTERKKEIDKGFLELSYDTQQVPNGYVNYLREMIIFAAL